MVVLGSADHYPGSYDLGYGTQRPREIFNGGVPSGRLMDIRWTHWGEAQAFGKGEAFIYRPGGGYYDGTVPALLRAEAIRDCKGTKAYTRLYVREPDRPGAPPGPWFLWTDDPDLCVED